MNEIAAAGLLNGFAAAMQRLGPYTSIPRLAVAVSGGADSMALALLAQRWSAERGGAVHAIIIDHGLRAASADEAALTQTRLAGRGISVTIITLSGLAGPGLQARARAARYAALTSAAKANACLHLLLGHHAGDQTETIAMRAARGPRGLEGMPAWSARSDILLLRPLLNMPAAGLRAFLQDAGMAWVEDPANADPKFERVRIRQGAAGRVPAAATVREAEEQMAAEFLARHAMFRPEGFAVLDAGAAPVAALAGLLRSVAGSQYPPARAAITSLATRLRPATLGGVQILPAGRLGPGWLLAREPAACGPPVPARAGAVWDHRFRLTQTRAEAIFGALGADAAKFRHAAGLPSLVLRTMPCLRCGRETAFPLPPALALFCPPAPAAGHPFLA